MQQRQTGFTLIELITVIVILGALSVIALPRFIDLQDEAEQAATDGVAGSLAAASATNLAAALAGDTAATTVTNCNQVSGLLASAALPNASYTVQDGGLGATTGATATCTLENNNGGAFTSTFTGYAVPAAP